MAQYSYSYEPVWGDNYLSRNRLMDGSKNIELAKNTLSKSANLRIVKVNIEIKDGKSTKKQTRFELQSSKGLEGASGDKKWVNTRTNRFQTLKDAKTALTKDILNDPSDILIYEHAPKFSPYVWGGPDNSSRAHGRMTSDYILSMLDEKMYNNLKDKLNSNSFNGSITVDNEGFITTFGKGKTYVIDENSVANSSLVQREIKGNGIKIMGGGSPEGKIGLEERSYPPGYRLDRLRVIAQQKGENILFVDDEDAWVLDPVSDMGHHADSRLQDKRIKRIINLAKDKNSGIGQFNAFIGNGLIEMGSPTHIVNVTEGEESREIKFWSEEHANRAYEVAKDYADYISLDRIDMDAAKQTWWLGVNESGKPMIFDGDKGRKESEYYAKVAAATDTKIKIFEMHGDDAKDMLYESMAEDEINFKDIYNTGKSKIYDTDSKGAAMNSVEIELGLNEGAGFSIDGVVQEFDPDYRRDGDYFMDYAKQVKSAYEIDEAVLVNHKGETFEKKNRLETTLSPIHAIEIVNSNYQDVSNMDGYIPDDNDKIWVQDYTDDYDAYGTPHYPIEDIEDLMTLIEEESASGGTSWNGMGTDLVFLKSGNTVGTMTDERIRSVDERMPLVDQFNNPLGSWRSPEGKSAISWSNPQLGNTKWTVDLNVLSSNGELPDWAEDGSAHKQTGFSAWEGMTTVRGPTTSKNWIPIVTDSNVKVGGGATLKSGQVGFSKSQFQFARSYGTGKSKIRYVSRKAGDGLVIWNDKRAAKSAAAAAREDGYLIRTVPVASGFVNLAARRKHYPNWNPNWSQSNEDIMKAAGIPKYKSPQTNEMKRLNIEPDVTRSMHPSSIREYWRRKNA